MSAPGGCSPEAEAPAGLTLKGPLTRPPDEDIHFTEDNTEITFDEEGNLTVVL